MEKHFANPENKEIFLCSTLHRDNLSSKYVSEFFGLTDCLYVKRRQGGNREVHMCRIAREEVDQYLMSISDRLAVLYGYNPKGKRISQKVKIKVLEEQLSYEKKEYERLKKARKTNRTFKGNNLKFIDSKLKKIQRLEKKLEEVSKGGNSEHGEH